MGEGSWYKVRLSKIIFALKLLQSQVVDFIMRILVTSWINQMPISYLFFDQKNDPRSYKNMFKEVQKNVMGIESRDHIMINNSQPVAQDMIIRKIMGDYASRTGNFFCFHGRRSHTKEVRELLNQKHEVFTIDSFITHLAHKIPKADLNLKGSSLVRRLIFAARACYQIDELQIARDPQDFINTTWDRFANKPLTMNF